MELIGETELFAKLNEANIDFDTDFGMRTNEKAARTGSNVFDARGEVDPIYDTIIQNINALAVVEGDADYVEIIDRINVHIAYYKNVLGNRRGRSRAADAADAAEPTEPTEPTELT